MPYNDNHYKKQAGGDYDTKAEAERAASNGHLTKLSNGDYWDKETGETYWSDGTKKS